MTFGLLLRTAKESTRRSRPIEVVVVLTTSTEQDSDLTRKFSDSMPILHTVAFGEGWSLEFARVLRDRFFSRVGLNLVEKHRVCDIPRNDAVKLRMLRYDSQQRQQVCPIRCG